MDLGPPVIAVAGFVAFALLDPPFGVILLVVGLVVEVAETAFWFRFLKRYRIRTGVEALIGEPAEVVGDCRPRGKVRLRGELWNAECPEGAAVGERVRIAGVEGLTLRVERDLG